MISDLSKEYDLPIRVEDKEYLERVKELAKERMATIKHPNAAEHKKALTCICRAYKHHKQGLRPTKFITRKELKPFIMGEHPTVGNRDSNDDRVRHYCRELLTVYDLPIIVVAHKYCVADDMDEIEIAEKANRKEAITQLYNNKRYDKVRQFVRNDPTIFDLQKQTTREEFLRSQFEKGLAEEASEKEKSDDK